MKNNKTIFFKINETLFKTFSSYKNKMKTQLEKLLGNLFFKNQKSNGHSQDHRRNFLQ